MSGLRVLNTPFPPSFLQNFGYSSVFFISGYNKNSLKNHSFMNFKIIYKVEKNFGKKFSPNREQKIKC